MNAAIILVGTELLNGMTLDTNSIYIAEELNKYGIEIKHKLLVGDNIDHIIDAINYSKSKSKLIIIIGGLGPTIDDVTKLAIAKFLNTKLIVDRSDYEELRKKYESYNLFFNNTKLKEAEKPEGSQLIANDLGMCKGIYINNIAAFPGVPRELFNIFPKFLDLLLATRIVEDKIFIKDILVFGISESDLEERVIKLLKASKLNYEFLVKDYGIILRLQTKKKNSFSQVLNKLYEKIGKNIIGEDNDRLEILIYKYLKSKKLVLSTAESCTGGMLASKFVEIKGVSKVFKEGIVCYSNESKNIRLGVTTETLNRFGAVSSQTCDEMLKGLTTECKIAVTGIAGPTGGTKAKPVGTVYIGTSINNNKIIKKYFFHGSREAIRRHAMMNAMFQLFKIFKNSI